MFRTFALLTLALLLGACGQPGAHSGPSEPPGRFPGVITDNE
ncbi:MAG: hypothetical protein AAFQ66_01430 [Pseudomonadota bacterium]